MLRSYIKESFKADNQRKWVAQQRKYRELVAKNLSTASNAVTAIKAPEGHGEKDIISNITYFRG